MKPKCKLCLINDANQTGSHLTSCFIVASQIGERDEEKGYLITTDPEQDYSENLKADGIKEDYIFCLGCEKRLSYLEGYFSQEVTNKIGIAKFQANFPIIYSKENTEIINCSNTNPIAFHLLIYSIIWRASISHQPLFVRFLLPKNVEENIRQVLDAFLPEYKDFKIQGKLRHWLRDIKEVPDLFEFYPYTILKAKQIENNTANLIYFSSDDNHPYHIIINEFIILAFFEEGDIDFSTQDFFELNEKFHLHEALNNDVEEIKIGILREEDWKSVMIKMFTLLKDQRVTKILSDCARILIMQGISPTWEYMKLCYQQKTGEIEL